MEDETKRSTPVPAPVATAPVKAANHLDFADRLLKLAMTPGPFMPRIRSAVLWVFACAWIRGSIVMVLMIGLIFTLKLYCDVDKDNATITNVGFAMLASLASLSFGCSRAIESVTNEQDRFAYCGERFFHAAVMMLVGSVVKYGWLIVSATQIVSSRGWLMLLIRTPVLLMLFGLFFHSLFSAHTGLRILNELLWTRMTRQPDWDD